MYFCKKHRLRGCFAKVLEAFRFQVIRSLHTGHVGPLTLPNNLQEEVECPLGTNSFSK